MNFAGQPAAAVADVGPFNEGIVKPHPIRIGSRVHKFPAGLTLAQMLDLSGIPKAWHGNVDVHLEATPIDPAYWHVTRPKAGVRVYIAVRAGKSGGGGGKNPLITVLGIVFAIASIAFAGPLGAAILGGADGAIAGAVGASAFSAISQGLGALIIGAVGFATMYLLSGPPKPVERPDLNGGVPAPSFSITGTQNRANPWGPIPRVYGKRRVYPVLAARPYTESEGNKNYIRLLLCAGWGPLQLSELKIGETDLSAFTGVEVETREGWPDDDPVTLYTTVIRESALNVLVAKSADWITQTTLANSSEATFDMTFPQGLAVLVSTGGSNPRTVVFEAQYKAVADSSWTNITWANSSEDGFGTPGQFTITDDIIATKRVSGRFKFPASGQYDVRFRRTTDDDTSSNAISKAYLTAFRSIEYRNPVGHVGLALIAIRIQATEQLNGVPDSINCIAESYFPVYDGDSWAWEISRSPAWGYAHSLRYRGPDRLLADDRIDLEAIKDWADICAAAAQDGDPYWRFDAVIEGGSVFNACRTIAAHVRATPTMRDGKYSIALDIEKDTPVQHITPRNSWSYSGERHYIDVPHALKLRWTNPDIGYQEDEAIVYADGYNEDGSDGLTAATRFESADYLGCTVFNQVWREGRFQLAQMLLRPEQHKVYQSLDGNRCTLGDYVMFAYDVVSIGQCQGRIISRTLNEDDEVVSYTLDENVTMESGKTYGMRCRLKDGSSLVVSVDTVVGENQRTVTPVTPIPVALAPDLRDLFMFGETDLESAPMLVRNVSPGPELTVQLTLMDAQPGVWDADKGEIPPYETYATSVTPYGKIVPPAPILDALVSDESVAAWTGGAIVTPRIMIPFWQPASDVAIKTYELQYRATGSGSWIHAQYVSGDVRAVFLAGVIQGKSYETRIRAIGENNYPSEWAQAQPHVVVGRSTLPPNVGQVFFQGNVFAWNYANIPLDVQHGGGFLVKFHYGENDHFDTGIAAHNDLIAGTSIPVAVFPGNTLITIMVKAVDSDGNESETASTLVVTTPTPPVDNLLYERDYEAEGWIGDIEAAAIGPSSLAATGSESMWLPGSAPMWTPGEDIMWDDDYGQLVYRFWFVPPVAGAELSWDIVFSGAPRSFEFFALTDSSETLWPDDGETLYADDGVPFWGEGEWRSVPAKMTLPVAGAQWDFRIMAGGGPSQGVIETLVAKLDVVDIRERLLNVAIASGGSALPTTKPFSVYVAVEDLALLDDGGDAKSLRIKSSLPSASPPVIECFDASGAPTTGHVNARPVGY